MNVALNHQTDNRTVAVFDLCDHGFGNRGLANVSMSQSTQATVQANIAMDISTTVEQIDALPETTLSDDEKMLLKGMIADLTEKDKRKRETKLQKLEGWLSTKGTDVFIAAMPYVVQIVKTQMGL